MLSRLHVLDMRAAACRTFAMRRTGDMCATAWRMFGSHVFLSGAARQLEKWARNVIVSVSPNRFKSDRKGKCDVRASTNLHI